MIILFHLPQFISEFSREKNYDKKVSYCKQIARQYSCQKILAHGLGWGVVNPVKFSLVESDHA